MDTVEIVVYLFVAVIIGGLVLFATYELASQNITDELQNQLDDTVGFAVVESQENLAEYLFSVWSECDFGANTMNVTFQYTGETLTKEELFEEVQRLNVCRSLSSQEFNCGEREDLINDEIEPGIKTAVCTRENGAGQLEIR